MAVSKERASAMTPLGPVLAWKLVVVGRVYVIEGILPVLGGDRVCGSSEWEGVRVVPSLSELEPASSGWALDGVRRLWMRRLNSSWAGVDILK